MQQPLVQFHGLDCTIYHTVISVGSIFAFQKNNQSDTVYMYFLQYSVKSL